MSEPELLLPAGKNIFKPEELYRFTKIKPFVLRFWESEFPSLTPKKDGDQGLTYSRADVKMILAIKRLLYDEGLTVDEARRRLAGGEDQDAKKKTSGTAGTKKKKKTTAKKPAVSNGDGKARKGKATSAAVAATSKSGKARGKRGLPLTGTPRHAVSIEDLLPDNVVGEPATKTGLPASADPPAKKSAGSTGPVEQGKKPDNEKMRKKMSGVLAQLREILTFLDKGDR